MSDLKTKPTRKSVKKFLFSVEHEQRRSDALQLLSLFETVTKQKPVLWGNNIAYMDVGKGREYKCKDARR